MKIYAEFLSLISYGIGCYMSHCVSKHGLVTNIYAKLLNYLMYYMFASNVIEFAMSIYK